MKKITMLFTTLILAAFSWQGNAQILTESFDAVTYPPTGWTNTQESGVGLWNRATTGTSPTCTPHSGAGMSRYNCYSISTGAAADLSTVVVDLSAGGPYQVSFWMYRDNGYLSNVDKVDVYANTTQASAAGTLLGTINRSTGLAPIESANGWYNYTFAIPGSFNTSTNYLIFKATSAYGNNIFIDDVSVELVPTCPAPSALTATNITTTSADLGWTSAGNLWDIEWGATGFVQGAGTMVTGAMVNPHALSGLTANTSYDFYVRNDCGPNGTSSWAGPFSFTTACLVITPNYTQPFTTFVPDACWNEADAGSFFTGPTSVGASPWQAGTAIGNTARINLYNAAHSDWVLTPYFDLSLGGYEVVIDVAVTNWNNASVDAMGSDDSVRVVYTEDNITWNNLITFTAVNNLPNSLTTFSALIPSTASNVRFGILATDGPVDNTEDYDFHIDNFIVRTPPSCPAPTALAATNITTTSADLGWTSAGTLWDIEWGATGFVQGAGTMVTGAMVNPHALSGLTAYTSYDFYVRNDCGTGTSIWSGPYSFYTGYCTPASSGSATFVDDFSTTNGSANISNLVSGFTAGGYFDGTAQSVQSYANGSFDFNAAIVGGTAGFSIWIDWNNDLIFDNLTEKEFNTTTYGNGPFIGTINIPGAIANGNYRMRITTDWNASNPSDPCASVIRAEFEDYTLNIITQSANDIGVFAIQSTPVGCGLGMETVTVKVKNYGTTTESGFDVVYSLNGTPVTPETVVGSILPGDTLTHVFTALANMSTPAVYTIDAWTDLTTDGNNNNDTLNGWTTEHIASSLTYNGMDVINTSTGVQSIICTNGLVNNMLDNCYKLSALVIDSLTHVYNGDVDIFLISPVGDTLEVSTGNGGNTDNYINVTFTDSALTYITGNNPIPGFYHTEDSLGLAKFNGTDPNGAWTLWVSDNYPSLDDGVLYQWHLEFTDYNFVVDLGLDSNACSNSSVTLNAVTGNYSYLWSTGDNTQQITIDTNSLGGNGTYNISVVVTDTISGCESVDTIVVTFSPCAGINAASNNVNVNVYPNPNNGEFTLNINTTDINQLAIQVVNLQGQVVYNKNNFNNLANVNEQVNLSDNANGIYFVIITTDKGVVTHKLVIQ